MTSDADRGDDVLVVRRRHVDDSGTGRRADVLDAARCRRPNPKLVVEKRLLDAQLESSGSSPSRAQSDGGSRARKTGTPVTIGMKGRESEQKIAWRKIKRSEFPLEKGKP